MDDVAQTPNAATPGDAQNFWSELDPPQWIAARAAMRARRVARGETLIERGAAADTLYVVNFGLFEVRGADGRALAEIGANELIGEIGFFAGERRTASVVAVRDSEALAIRRAEFEALCERAPEVRRAVARSLAQRLARLAPVAHRLEPPRLGGAMRIVTLVGAGAPAPPLTGFVQALRASLAKFGRTGALAAGDAPPDAALADHHAFASWLGGFERAHDIVICVADESLTDWTRAALRSADQILLVAAGAASPPGEVEALAHSIVPPERRRLALTHDPAGASESASAWLRGREVVMTHHVAGQDASDFDRLASAYGRIASLGSQMTNRICLGHARPPWPLDAKSVAIARPRRHGDGEEGQRLVAERAELKGCSERDG